MSLFAFIKGRVPIADVVSSRIRLKQAGTYLKGSCPFHQEKTASFTVSPDKGIYYCFGCQATGDVISFVATIENTGQIEAARHLIEQFKLVVPPELLQKHAKSAQNSKEKKSFFAVCQFVARWAHDNFKKHPEAYNYVQKRGLSAQTCDLFMVGYMPAGVAALKQLTKEASREGILVKDLIQAGILYESRMSLRSPFEQRILFPITDTLGRYCGFGGRVFSPGDERAKYYNSKESDFFIKGHLLFGWTLAKKSIQERKEVFLVEGYTDCVSMAQHGYTNTVATLGTSCTKEHLSLLARHAHVLTVLYDGDAAGLKAILRLTELCWQVNIEVRVAFLSDGHDPASYIEAHGNLEGPLQASQDIFSFYVARVSERFAEKSLADQLAVVDRLLQLILGLDDLVKQELLLQRVSAALALPIETLRKHVKAVSAKHKPAHTHASQEKPEQSVRSDADHQSLERHIVAASMNSLLSDSLCIVKEEGYRLFSPQAVKIFTVLSRMHHTYQGQELFDAVLDALNEKEKTWASSLSMQYDGVLTKDEWLRLVDRFVQQKWKGVLKDLREEIAQATQEGDQKKVEELLGRFTKLKQNMKTERFVAWLPTPKK